MCELCGKLSEWQSVLAGNAGSCQHILMSQEEKHNNEQLADELLVLEKEANGETGIALIRSIAMLWKRGDVEDARQLAWSENDKLRQYPEIQQWLEGNLFGPDIDSPLKASARMKKMLERENS